MGRKTRQGEARTGETEEQMTRAVVRLRKIVKVIVVIHRGAKKSLTQIHKKQLIWIEAASLSTSLS